MLLCPVRSQVLAENNQLRKEADDLGPRAELEHWKKRLSTFNYLLDQLKSPDVKAVLAVLAAAKSKLLKVLSRFLLLYEMYGNFMSWTISGHRVTGNRKKMSLYLHEKNIRLDNVAPL